MAATSPPRRRPFMNRAVDSQPRRLAASVSGNTGIWAAASAGRALRPRHRHRAADRLADADPRRAAGTPAVIPTSCDGHAACCGQVGVERAAADVDRVDLAAERRARPAPANAEIAVVALADLPGCARRDRPPAACAPRRRAPAQPQRRAAITLPDQRGASAASAVCGKAPDSG